MSIQLQRILAEDTALQKKSIRGTGAIADFAQPIHTLIGVDANDGTRTRPRFHDSRHAEVGDLQRRRTRIGVDALGIGFRHFTG